MVAKYWLSSCAALFFSSIVFCNSAYSITEAAAQQLLIKLYSVKSSQYEFGRFNENRYSPLRRCALLRTFFVDALLQIESVNGCDTVEDLRYAPITFGAEYRFPEPGIEHVPYWKIGELSLHEDFAQVGVYSSWLPFGEKSDLKNHPGGKITFFIKVIDGRPKIFNLVKFPEWPWQLVENRCMENHPYAVLRPSTQAELKVIPEKCRFGMEAYWGADGRPSASKGMPKP